MTSAISSADPDLYAPPQQFRDVALILCELGHTLAKLGDEHSATGDETGAQRRYGEAAQAFRDAIREHPNSADLYLHLARVRLQQGQADEGLNLLVEAVRLAPQRAGEILPEAHRWLTPARANSLLPHLSGSLEPLLDKRGLDGMDRAAISAFLARAHLYQGKMVGYKQAHYFYKRAQQMHPDVYSAEGLGHALYELGDMQGAINFLEQAVAMADAAPESGRQAPVRLKLAKVLLALNQPEKAQAVAQIGLEQRGDENNAAFHTVLGQTYLAVQQPDYALKHAAHALETDPHLADAHAVRAEAFVEMSRFEEALAAADAALENDPRHDKAVLIKARALLHRDPPEWEQAIRYLQLYGRAHPAEMEETFNLLVEGAPYGGEAEGFLYLARLWQREQRPEKALEKVNEALDLGLGDEQEIAAYELQGALLQALDRTPDEQAAAYFHAGQRRSWRWEFGAAVDLFELALSLQPDHQQAGWHLADALRMQMFSLEKPETTDAERRRVADEQKRMLQRSREVWEAATRRGQPTASDAWVYTTRALLLDEIARREPDEPWQLWWEAVVYLERALLLKPGDAYAWAYLARYYRYIQIEANALHAARRALEYGPDALPAQEEASAVFALAGSFEDSIKLVESRREDDNYWARGVEAYAYYQDGQFETALAILQEALANLPVNSDTVWIYDVLADCLQIADQKDAARQIYEDIWEARNEDSFNQGFFAWAAYEVGNYEEAIRRNTALLQRPEEEFVYIAVNLGLSYLAAGNVEQGRHFLEEGINTEKGFDGVRRVRYRELSERDLPELLNRVQGKPFKDEVSALVAWARAETVKRLEALQTRPSPLEELEKLDAPQAPVLADSGVNWFVYGVNAGRARLLREDGDEDERQADEIYRQLYAWSRESGEALPPFPEAELVMGKR